MRWGEGLVAQGALTLFVSGPGAFVASFTRSLIATGLEMGEMPFGYAGSTGRRDRQDRRASRQDHHGTLDRRRLLGRAPYIWPTGPGSGMPRCQC